MCGHRRCRPCWMPFAQHWNLRFQFKTQQMRCPSNPGRVYSVASATFLQQLPGSGSVPVRGQGLPPRRPPRVGPGDRFGHVPTAAEPLRAPVAPGAPRGGCRDGAWELGRGAESPAASARAGPGSRGRAQSGRAEPGPGRAGPSGGAGPGRRGEQRGLGPVPARPGAQRRGESAGTGPGLGLCGADAVGRGAPSGSSRGLQG